MKKSFTLLEVVITVTIFMIILIFLYRTLDNMKIFNDKFEKKIDSNIGTNSIYEIFLEDVAESFDNLSTKNLDVDRNKNVILKFKSNNTYHNAFFTNITYMISSSNYLIRIESRDEFLKEKTPISFHKNSYVDVILENIEKFVVLMPKNKSDHKLVFIIKQKNKEEMVFTTFRMEN